MPDWPRSMQPATDGEPVGDPVEVFQHNALNTDELVVWAGGDRGFVNGGPVVVVGGTRRAVDRLVGLGDYAVRDGDRFWAETADGFSQRYQPT
jgi:hypothetical protein